MKILLIFLLFSFSLYAQTIDLSVEIRSTDEIQLEIGESLSAEILIRPSRAIKFDPQSLIGKKIAGYLHVADISKYEISPNNSDYMQIKADLVFSRPFSKQTQSQWFFANQFWKINYTNIIFKNSELQEKQNFTILEQDYTESFLTQNSTLYIWLAIIFTSICFFLYAFLKKKFPFRDRSTKKRLKKLKENWFQVLTQARSREDIERIYSLRSELGELFEDIPSDIKNYLNNINEHQYKEKLEQEILEELIAESKKISHVFEDGYGV